MGINYVMYIGYYIDTLDEVLEHIEKDRSRPRWHQFEKFDHDKWASKQLDFDRGLQ